MRSPTTDAALIEALLPILRPDASIPEAITAASPALLVACIRETAAAALAELEDDLSTLAALDPSPRVRDLGAELQAAAAQLVTAAERLAAAMATDRLA
jgi:hypothetical protein